MDQCGGDDDIALVARLGDVGVEGKGRVTGGDSGRSLEEGEVDWPVRPHGLRSGGVKEEGEKAAVISCMSEGSESRGERVLSTRASAHGFSVSLYTPNISLLLYPNAP